MRQDVTHASCVCTLCCKRKSSNPNVWCGRAPKSTFGVGAHSRPARPFHPHSSTTCSYTLALGTHPVFCNVAVDMLAQHLKLIRGESAHVCCVWVSVRLQSHPRSSAVCVTNTRSQRGGAVLGVQRHELLQNVPCYRMHMTRPRMGG